MRLRVATFNIENLFTRFDFNAFSNPRDAAYLAPIVQFYSNAGDGDLTRFPEFKRLVEAAAVSQDDDKRQHTALSFAALDADIVAFQEVDSLDALTRFMDAYVKKLGVDNYPHLALHEGNDMRGIDVAVLSRDIRPIYTRSHAHLTGGWLDNTASGKALLDAFPLAKAALKKLGRGRIFRRDCLEVEVGVGPQRVSLFVCHFKSMSGGRDESIGMRQLEAITVREIVTRKFSDPSAALWAIAGDLNDYRAVTKISSVQAADGSYVETREALAADKPSGVDPLINDGFGVNTLDLLPETERWTHYYSGDRHKTQLDYIIASPALRAKVVGLPHIVRAGMPWRVPNLGGLPRHPRVGWDRPKASDHCPVVVEFDI